MRSEGLNTQETAYAKHACLQLQLNDMCPCSTKPALRYQFQAKQFDNLNSCSGGERITMICIRYC